MAPALLHAGQFRRQYEQFWEDPEATPIVWVGLLFSILYLANFALHSVVVPRSQAIELEARGKPFRERAVQCLILGKYTKGGPFVLESLILYLATEALPSEDAKFCNYLLVGIIVNLALRTGYHRDSKHFPSISPFEGEMRRRVWSTLYVMDIVVSSQMGLPRMIRDQQVDTEMPRNLFDRDFDEDTAVMPPSRPDTELTPMLYCIAKRRVASLWEIVSNVSTDIQLCPYDQVLRIDQSIKDARLRLPPVLRWGSMADSITEPLNLLVQRLWLEIAFLKLQVVLHKRYALPWLSREYHRNSQEVCLEACMKMLEFQHMVYEETLSGGHFFEFNWMLACLLNQEYLLAASMLCAYIQQGQPGPGVQGSDIPEQRIRQLLEKSLDIWERSRTNSTESQKVAEVLAVILRTTGTKTTDPRRQDTGAVPAFASQDYLANFDFPFNFDPMIGDGMAFSFNSQLQGSFLDETCL